MKKLLKIVLGILLALVLVVGAYVAYVFIAYYRLEDNMPLEVEQSDFVNGHAGRQGRPTVW